MRFDPDAAARPDCGSDTDCCGIGSGPDCACARRRPPGGGLSQAGDRYILLEYGPMTRSGFATPRAPLLEDLRENPFLSY